MQQILASPDYQQEIVAVRVHKLDDQKAVVNPNQSDDAIEIFRDLMKLREMKDAGTFFIFKRPLKFPKPIHFFEIMQSNYCID